MDEILTVIEGTLVIVPSQEIEIVEVAAQGPAGPPGPAGPSGAGVIEIPFAFGDATPKTLLTVPAEKTVYGTGIHIFTAFDGTGPALQIGDADDPGRLMPAGSNAPGEVGSYLASPNHRYATATVLFLTITPGGGASQGAGIVILQVQQ
ncbi:MAG: hypothetical protein ACREXW_00990 [Gammaproteobacteria bacterium]